MHADAIGGPLVIEAMNAGGVLTESIRNVSKDVLKKVHALLLQIYYENPPFDSPELTKNEEDIVYALIRDVQRLISTTCN